MIRAQNHRRILVLAPPLGRPSSWRPDGRRGRLSGRRSSGSLRRRPSRPIQHGLPETSGRKAGGGGRQAPQARAEIARAVRRGRFPLRPPEASHRERVKTPRPEGFRIRQPRGAPRSRRNGQLHYPFRASPGRFAASPARRLSRRKTVASRHDLAPIFQEPPCPSRPNPNPLSKRPRPRSRRSPPTVRHRHHGREDQDPAGAPAAQGLPGAAGLAGRGGEASARSGRSEPSANEA
jgi:hypothetical protein